MGRLTKQTFKNFVESECERQLFLELGEGDARWLAPLRGIERGPFEQRRGANTIAELGVVYEQTVYRVFRHDAATRCETAPTGEVVESALTARRLEGAAEGLRAQPRICLLEHAWEVPERFVRHVLELEPGEPIPLETLPSRMRPDLIVLERQAPVPEAPLRELLADGTTRALSADDLAHRIALRVIDIKHTQEQRVGATHLIELLVYAHALASFLEAHELRSSFYVPTHGHGIFPQLEVAELAVVSLSSLDRVLVPLVWEDVVHLYGRTRRTMARLRRSAPRAIESVEVNLRAGCGRCRFLEDCKRSLGWSPDGSAAEWDLRLLPYTSRSIAAQLREERFRTIGDVAARLATHVHSSAPQPLYAEQPLLALKAHALVRREPLPAEPQYTGGQRHLTMAVPRYSELELVFDVETDPTHDVVFAVALRLVCGVMPNAAHRPAFERWWAFWREALSRRAVEQVEPAQVEALLEADFLREDWYAAGPHDARRRELHAAIRAFGRALASFDRASDGSAVQIYLAGDDLHGKPVRTAFATFDFAYVSGGVEVRHERKLAENVVQRVHELLTLCDVIERLVRARAVGPFGPWSQGPTFAGFYWSREQLEHVEDLLERHLTALVHDDTLRGRFLELLGWLSPTDSAVAHHLQHKKIFDVRAFVETSLGLPHIINYSWHDLAREAFQMRFRRAFWAPHFNYMDFATWQAFVADDDTLARMRHMQEISREILLKVGIVHRLLRKYRALAAGHVAREAARPADSGALRSSPLSDEVHPLGRVWYMFARLAAATQRLKADFDRTTFPAWSIGRLAAAEVSALQVIDAQRVQFELAGISANMKLDAGDRALLLPESGRDVRVKDLPRYELVIEQLHWDAARAAYRVEARRAKTWGDDVHPLLTGEQALGDEPWFLYGSASDTWSERLWDERRRGLLQRHGLGTSWLGVRLAYLWQIGAQIEVPEPASLTFTAPEVYLYAPTLLPSAPPEPGASLRTTVHPPPDASQAEAIQVALASTLSCLQGPPGTGKSQTIAALLDEFLVRRAGQTTRILVTAFSYSALEVVLDKVRSSRDAAGLPTLAARTRLIVARSESRAPTARPGVDDLVCTRKNLVLNGTKLSGSRKRLEDHVCDSFILFANAYQLYHLGHPSGARRYDFENVHNDFGFDLVVVDEASQVPTDHFLAVAGLLKRAEVRLGCEVSSWPARSVQQLQTLEVLDAPPVDALTRVVIVGDHNQLPPVQPVKPPRNLCRVLSSIFTYFVDGHGVEHHQLRVNYRSAPAIVEFTRRLRLYERDLAAFHAEHQFADPIPPVPSTVTEPWLRDLLDPSRVVATLVHERQFDTAVSPLEAWLVAKVVVGFHRQLGVATAEAERDFWSRQVGIVAPHNAHGRLVRRCIKELLADGPQRLTALDDAELDACLRGTVYSVEKFQGSDRTFIVGTIGVASLDQLGAEESFVYDLNRFNVLTSRARQKILLVCSRNFLEYVPRDRDQMGHAARIRAYAFEFCNASQALEVSDAEGEAVVLEARWFVAEPGAAAASACGSELGSGVSQGRLGPSPRSPVEAALVPTRSVAVELAGHRIEAATWHDALVEAARWLAETRPERWEALLGERTLGGLPGRAASRRPEEVATASFVGPGFVETAGQVGELRARLLALAVYCGLEHDQVRLDAAP